MHKLINKLFPVGSKRRKLISITKRKFKSGCIKVYRLIPFTNLKKILKKSANKIGMYNTENKNLIINSDSKIMVYDKHYDKYSECFELEEITSSIAVHLHLYYKDLVTEMIYYLNNIPFQFDLYVSVSDEKDNSKIEKSFQKIKNVKKVVVKVCKNSGRDYGPMMVEFGSILSKYDYIAHIHTKKSLRMGKEQDFWRKHLLDGIMGSESLIRKIFYMFESENIGIFFPDSVHTAPYWANTWMGANFLGRKILGELGLPFKDEYQDFSVGSMFWVRTKAAKEVFKRKWTYIDFGKEEGLNDSTLAYVFERIFVLNSNFNHYDFICYNKEKNLFYKNYSDRNMQDYYSKSIDTLFEKLCKYDVISFDIFDTLITRKIYSPDDLFDLIGKNIKTNKFDKNNFKSLRRQAEIIAIEKGEVGDPSIHDIYDEFAKINNLTKKEKEEIKDLEIQYEKKFLISRKDSLELFNRLKKANKRIIITSDMYLTSDILKEILESLGYTGYEKLYVSCEINLRKDKGNIWDYLKKEYQDVSFIHIGDNEESDVHKLWDYGVNNEHIMQGKKMFENTRYGYFNKNCRLNETITSSILYGLIINKNLFNSPFKFNKSSGEYIIEDNYDFGYSVVGPIILYYLLWLIKNKKQNEQLLFLSREGYYLEKLFDQLCNGLDIKDINKLYFQTSRRCVTVAKIENKEDIYKLLDIEYYGDMKNFMHYRYGVDYKGKNFNVILNDENPKNNKIKVQEELDNYIDKILANAKKERKNYLSYINKNIKNTDLCVVDLGYSGTTQLYLSELLNKKISGKYLVVKNEPKPLKIGCQVQSCFNELKNDNNHLLYKNSLFLECFLTAPHGQLMYFDDKINPVYINEKLIKEKFKYLDQIYEGVKSLFDDMIELCGKEMLEEEINKDTLINLYQAFLLESNHFIEKNKKIFEFEDYYCRSENIVIEKL